MKNFLLAQAALAVAGLAQAHGGHGQPAEHWHAGDGWGFAMIAAVVGAMLWLRRGGE